jgi:CRISPR-associated endonuclease/helicase Cas3
VSDLKQALGLPTDHSPFPWQEEILQQFRGGIQKRVSLDIPTGLGKTSVIAAWLLARAQGATLPRRLIYVVDRRTVVDQATREAERLRSWVDASPEVKAQLGLANGQSLPISTLRGQHADNREWLDDPSASAIIIGTVDMIGSRLLFEGYGVSRKMRPFHGGLLGADCLFVLDESHLVPPFEAMLESLVCDCRNFGPETDFLNPIPSIKLLTLSATGRSSTGSTWTLTDADLKHPIVQKRLGATKRLSFHESDGSCNVPELLAREAWNLTEQGRNGVRVIVFSNSRKDAQAARNATEELAKGNKKQGISPVVIATELLVGARRVHERDQVTQWLIKHGFLGGSEKASQPAAFLFATSAGEVGIDLDADHMVCDLVAWERMVQRFGRVNRRGNGDATIRVIVELPKKDKKTTEAIATQENKRTKTEQKKVDQYQKAVERVEKHRRAIKALPSSSDVYDASTGAIRQLKLNAARDTNLQDIISAAMSPDCLRPALTRPVVDAWSMTSLAKHTGRPLVAPWLRGWVDDEPQTCVLWRRHLPVRLGARATIKEQLATAEEFFEEAPPHLSETLEAESSQVFDWLSKRAKHILNDIEKDSVAKESTGQGTRLSPDAIVGVVLSPALSALRFVSLEELAFEGDAETVKRRKEDIERSLNDNTLIVDLLFGGLSESGLLDDSTSFQHRISGDDTDWTATGFRVRRCEAESRSDNQHWRTAFRFVTKVNDVGEPVELLLVEKQPHIPTSEDARAVAHSLQTLSAHQLLAEKQVERLAEILKLPPEFAMMLRIAARLHDEGKKSARWQNAFSAPTDSRPYAKTPGPVKPRLLDGYRHEFGSLTYLERDADFLSLSAELQELALHIVAAHHGFARPVINVGGCEDAPPSALEARARDVALRFARLQKRWGPWGLAWWESLLRAADQRASRLLDGELADETREATHG